MRQALLWTCLLFVLGGATAATADTAVLTSGEEIEGRLKAETLTVEGTAQGSLVIPLASIRTIRFDGSTVEIVLADGQKLAGKLQEDTLELDRGLFANSFTPDQLAELRIATRGQRVEIPQGTTVQLVLGESLESSSAQGGQEILFCVANDVTLGETVLLARGTPALGRVTRAQDAGTMSRQGELALAPQTILVSEEQILPVSGQGEFEGGLDSANFLTAGVFGFFAEGREAVIPAGMQIPAVTSSTIEIESGGTPGGSDEQREACQTLFRYVDAEVIPLDEVDYDTPLMPREKNLAVSLPLADIKSEPATRRSLRNLLVSDTFIQSLSIVREDRRKAIELDMRFVLVVLPSHDRYVDLTISVLDGDRVLARDVVRRIDAEEKKTKIVTRRLKVDRDVWEQAVASGNGLWKLEMTVNN